MEIHPTLAASLRTQQDAVPNDWEATFRQMALFDLATDLELGFFLSYYRNFAIPGIATTLYRNGEITQRPMKRSYDTAIVIYELIASGLDSSRGQEMVALLNRVHRNVPGSRSDFLYVLLTLLVVPVRWIQANAWRQPTSAELKAASRFFSELGARMHITAMPATYAQAEQFFDTYEAKRVAASSEGQHLMETTVQVFQSRLPAPFRPLAKQLISTMLDDDRLTAALGLPRTPRTVRAALQMGLKIRNAVHRRRPLKTEPHFTPGKAGSTLYPNGYSLDQIGPINVPVSPAASHERA
ncbi:oxygenase MpaB family protein [Arthrobacter sp. H16F315]|uniref:oxygenase MpaB family protein n=1 Tax=Arthrobacter sp. H16F315 TaxID=2955314 RepID=UPI002096CE75|nr:oxygenase MpaB family protein [Arthrobacter sp. H16F315]MDD1477898.1 oxygenase MpaB family protein [Arthrobacter sp. H16F315]